MTGGAQIFDMSQVSSKATALPKITSPTRRRATSRPPDVECSTTQGAIYPTSLLLAIRVSSKVWAVKMNRMKVAALPLPDEPLKLTGPYRQQRMKSRPVSKLKSQPQSCLARRAFDRAL